MFDITVKEFLSSGYYFILPSISVAVIIIQLAIKIFHLYIDTGVWMKYTLADDKFFIIQPNGFVIIQIMVWFVLTYLFQLLLVWSLAINIIVLVLVLVFMIMTLSFYLTAKLHRKRKICLDTLKN